MKKMGRLCKRKTCKVGTIQSLFCMFWPLMTLIKDFSLPGQSLASPWLKRDEIGIPVYPTIHPNSTAEAPENKAVEDKGEKFKHHILLEFKHAFCNKMKNKK